MIRIGTADDDDGFLDRVEGPVVLVAIMVLCITFWVFVIWLFLSW